MLRSIRWTVLFWYSLILVGALAALGWTLLKEMERTLYREADSQLESWAGTVGHVLEHYAPEKLSNELATILPKRATFAVWDGEGRSIAASDGVLPEDPRKLDGAETHGHLRLYGRPIQNGGWLVVGKSVEDEHHRVRDFLVVLFLASLAIVAVALGGGWILVGRALAPVGQIASTAQRISGENLGERIDAQRIQNELGGLAQTLNACFDRLEDAVARQVRFTADASHELRTPLAIALSHLELAATQDRSEAQLRERLAVVREAARRMQGVVEGLLTLARADAGSLEIERTHVDLKALLEEVRGTMEPLAASRGVTIENRLEPVTIMGDRERLRQIAANLYTNAVQYNREGGKVTASLVQEGRDAILRVSDTGVGIAFEDQTRIFERFFRAESARTRARGGSGLGLAIVHHLVGLHGGEVGVRSTPGEGSEFTVRLPAAS